MPAYHIPSASFRSIKINNMTHDAASDSGLHTKRTLSNSYTMAGPPVRGDNPRPLASGLSYVQVDKHGITILDSLHQSRLCTARDNLC